MFFKKKNQITTIEAGRAQLPGGVSPAQRLSGGDMFPMEQKPSRYGASDQREDSDVSLGGEDSREAAGHFSPP